MRDPCPSCGHLRRIVDRTPTSVTWACLTCSTFSDESFIPTAPSAKEDRP